MKKEEWIKELRVKLVEYGLSEQDAKEYGTDDDWHVYYDCGYTPTEAIEEDFSCI